ncbi:MAG: sensor domain-containing diguanylate cyclase [Simplicispira suum]|uniref:Histidine kinase n=2 Tax=Simplicispira suum TaxID=2109915 RepID=A0A2S0N4F4_9BURK|nr:histidine kinase [Simplicispira suum]MBW7832128.1 sensor domain-containing diguanylate cyclase [Simplicispira suum]
MFELAPVSLWLEDFSALKQLFDTWRAEGVTDLRAHLEADADRVRQCTASLKVLRANQRTLTLFAATSSDELFSQLDRVFRDDMHTRVADELDQLWAGALGFDNQTVNYALDGRRLDVLVHARILPGHEHTWSRVLVSLEDVTAQTQSTRHLQRSERYARDLFDHSPVSLWVEDFSAVKRLLDDVRAQGIRDFKTFLKVHAEFVSRCMQEIRVIDVNQQTLQMFGAASKEVLLNNIPRIFRGEMEESFAEQLQDLWDGKLVQQREVVNYALSGDAVHIHMQFSVLDGHRDDWGLVLLSLVDITARKKAEAYLEYLGKHDVLTQLRNRAFFVEELNRITRKGPWPLSVVTIDLNGLKSVNDDEGHAAGDALLRRVGEVLAKAVDASACAARIGGDEFTILLPGTDERGAMALTERILSLVELNNQFYSGQSLSLAIGVASCSSGDQVEAALHRADQAMYAEKARYYEERPADRRRR